jgi:hypothetical protein
MRRNADVHAPMARASERMAAADVTFLFAICRQPNTASARSESSQAMTWTSRVSSRCRRGEPNARRASEGSRPCSIASSMWEWSSSSISLFRRLP